MMRLFSALSVIYVLLSCSNNKNDKPDIVFADIKMIASPAGDSCAEPSLFTDKNGIVYLSWIEKKGEESSLKFSAFIKENWSEPIRIASGRNWFVNWADYPMMIADGDGNYLAHYLEKSDTGKFTYDIKLVYGDRSGNKWHESGKLNGDSVKAEHGFVSIIPYKNGYFASWLDGRKTSMKGIHNHRDGQEGGMTLRGAFLEVNGSRSGEWELDEKVCDCCQTSTTITDNGPVVVYRDRSDEEVRDMSIVRFVNGKWTKPAIIYADNWQIKACPVNGPRADALGNNLAIAWFSMRGKEAEVKIVFSKDGGKTFGQPIRIDEGKTIGRVDVVMIDSATAMVSWMEGSLIRAVSVHADGKKDPSIMVASSSDKRSSGFPQMTKSGDRVFFAWTDDQAKIIRFAQINR